MNRLRSTAASHAAAITVALACAACGDSTNPARCLLPVRGLEVLVESPSFGPGGSAAGSRFGAGWTAAGTPDRPEWSMPGSRATLEWINLGEETPRRLELAVLAPTNPESKLWVRSGSRIVARVPLAARTEVLLPDDLPPGRLALSLAVEGPGPLRLESATVHPVLPQGTARVVDHDIVQSGNSLVSFEVRLKGREVLIGTFEPPHDAVSGQRWQLEVDRPDGSPVRRFEWAPSFWNRLQGSRRIELPLRGVWGTVRIRLLALSPAASAPAARWRGLSLAAPPDRDQPPGL